HQQVVLPDLAAGCSMAEMAAIDQLEVCWQEMNQLGVGGVVPVTYINSTAAIKAFCGEHGGIVCTSSNAASVMRWAWSRRTGGRDFRSAHPTGKVIVHPECTFDVVQAADESGSTEFIIRTVTSSPEGSIWAVGTEIHLVNRLAGEVAPARTV